MRVMLETDRIGGTWTVTVREATTGRAVYSARAESLARAERMAREWVESEGHYVDEKTGIA